MTRVNVLSIDTLQSNDLVAGAASSGDKASNSGEFSKLVDSQMQTQQKEQTNYTSRASDKGANVDKDQGVNVDKEQDASLDSEHALDSKNTDAQPNDAKTTEGEESSSQQKDAQASDTPKQVAGEEKVSEEQIASQSLAKQAEQETKSDDFMTLLAKSEKWLSGDAAKGDKNTSVQFAQANGDNKLVGVSTSSNESKTNGTEVSGEEKPAGESESQNGTLSDKSSSSKLDELLAAHSSKSGEQKIDASKLGNDSQTSKDPSANDLSVVSQSAGNLAGKGNRLAQPTDLNTKIEPKLGLETAGAEELTEGQSATSLANAAIETDAAGNGASGENIKQLSGDLSASQGANQGANQGPSQNTLSASSQGSNTANDKSQVNEQSSVQSVNGQAASASNAINSANDQVLDAEQNAAAANDVQITSNQQRNTNSAATQRTGGEPSAHVQQLNAVADAAQAEQQEQNLNQGEHQQAETLQQQVETNSQQAQVSAPNSRMSFAESIAAANASQTHTTSSITNTENLTPEQVEQLEAAASRVIDSNLDIKKTQQLQTETINIYRRDFANAVKDKVMVMVNQKLQQVDIQLDPPELGNVHVRVNLQGDQAAVNFTVQNPQAKDALEQHMDKLRDMLQESGVDVGDANVAQQQQGSGQEQGRFGRGASGNEELSAAPENIAQLVKGSATGIDFYA
ncbi:flagellar hook-length control protein FliK [Thalassotalea euphylliae]|uniref:Flagellar hook-length control protein FliK n=1 Tax=Thalassotalea euphylliae TaxID=1655234 RepID=A0A3E0U0X9_9GAMM|nr:flagellar hook-length control protein FliK [Thalassotalea euphylliae]REL30257.1 flagellar hook-length control protein FliK [Thalassotalea euphylliae]